MKKFDVVALGELLIDFTENGKSESGNPLLEANPGGAPCNVLAMLRRLHKTTAFIGKVGKDSFGDTLIKTIEELGIDTSNVLQDNKVGTTLAFVHTREDGDRSFSFYRHPGADMMLEENEIDYTLIENSRIFHFGTLSMTDLQVRQATWSAVSYAKKMGCLLSFDPNLRPLLWENMNVARKMMEYGISQCDILKIADDEIVFFTGAETVEEAISKFLTMYQPKLMCVTLGRKGSIALYQGKHVYCEAILDENTMETTGAGDSFMACMLNYVLEHGLNDLTEEMLYEMQRFAGAAASIVTTRKGALKVMPTEKEVYQRMSV